MVPLCCSEAAPPPSAPPPPSATPLTPEGLITGTLCTLTNVQACCGSDGSCSWTTSYCGADISGSGSDNAGICDGTYTGSTLAVSGNQISGTIPTQIGLLTKLGGSWISGIGSSGLLCAPLYPPPVPPRPSPSHFSAAAAASCQQGGSSGR